AVDDVVAVAGEVRWKERREEPRAARQAFPNARPVHLGRAQGQRQIDDGADTERPAQPRALDQWRLFPVARYDRGDAHGRLRQPGHAVAIRQAGVERNDVVRTPGRLVRVVIDFAD